MTKQVVAVLGGTGLQGGGVVDALMGAGKFAVRVASLYTGVTRGKRLVVLVGQKKAVAIAVRLV